MLRPVLLAALAIGGTMLVAAPASAAIDARIVIQPRIVIGQPRPVVEERVVVVERPRRVVEERVVVVERPRPVVRERVVVVEKRQARKHGHHYRPGHHAYYGHPHHRHSDQVVVIRR